MFALFLIPAPAPLLTVDVIQVITLFRRKISSGHFTEALMTDALNGRAGALTELFRSSLMGITDALVS